MVLFFLSLPLLSATLRAPRESLALDGAAGLSGTVPWPLRGRWDLLQIVQVWAAQAAATPKASLPSSDGIIGSEWRDAQGLGDTEPGWKTLYSYNAKRHCDPWLSQQPHMNGLSRETPACQRGGSGHVTVFCNKSLLRLALARACRPQSEDRDTS